MFTIGVVDAVTGPVNKMIAKVDQLTHKVKSGMGDMAAGAAGMIAAGAMLRASLAPSIDSIAALGEVQSLGVAEHALEQLNSTAHRFTTRFGGDSATVIRSAYDIQSAIAGLTGDELSSFTEASGVLAVATKANVGNITSYLGTMYGIFENTANEMGKSNWVKQVAGQTAAAVQMFKTTGPQMEQAFSRLGSAATAHGVAMNEQMAILGELQATMSGSEAATKYQAFLTGIGKAQTKLGLTFTDSQGQLLPVVDIMQRITDKYGALDTVAKKDLMMDAFGSKQAVAFIDNLIPKTAKLASNIDALGEQKGMDKALEMANTIASPWDRLGGSINAAASALGQRLAPVIDPLVDMLASAFAYVVDFSEQFPVLTTVLTASAAAMLGLVAIGSAYTLVMGLNKVATAGWGMTMITVTSATRMFTGAQWLLNAALLANPIGIVIGLVGLLAAVIYKYWEPIKAFLGGFWEGFTDGLTPVFSSLGTLRTALSPLFSMLGALFDWFVNLFEPVSSTSQQLEGAATAGQLFGTVVGSVMNFLLAPVRALAWGVTRLGELFGWLATPASQAWESMRGPLSAIWQFLGKVFSYSPMGLVQKGYGKALEWLEQKLGGLKGALAKLRDLLGIDSDVSVATEHTQKDTTFSRHYGSDIVTRANNVVPLPTAIDNFAAGRSKPLTRVDALSANVIDANHHFTHSANDTSFDVIDKAKQAHTQPLSSVRAATTLNQSKLIQQFATQTQHSSQQSEDKRVYIDHLELRTDQQITKESLADLWELTG